MLATKHHAAGSECKAQDTTLVRRRTGAPNDGRRLPDPDRAARDRASLARPDLPGEAPHDGPPPLASPTRERLLQEVLADHPAIAEGLQQALARCRVGVLRGQTGRLRDLNTARGETAQDGAKRKGGTSPLRAVPHVFGFRV